MKRKNRIYGMMVCFFLIIFSGLFLIDPNLQTIGLLIVMFVGGYGLRETFEGQI